MLLRSRLLAVVGLLLCFFRHQNHLKHPSSVPFSCYPFSLTRFGASELEVYVCVYGLCCLFVGLLCCI